MSDERPDAGNEPPEREEFREDPVGHSRVEPGMSVGALVREYGKAGIGAADVAEAADIVAEMFHEDVTVFMGVAGAMVPAGMRQIITDLIEGGYVDALVTTGATLTHDSIEAIGGNHHHGRPSPPETDPRAHDETLRDEQVDRIYNVYLPQEHFEAFEHHLRASVFPEVERLANEPGTGAEGTVSIAQFTELLGVANAETNEAAGVEADAGIAAAAAQAGVPVHVPAVQDSVLGLQAWLRSQVAPFSLDALADMSALNDLAYHADRTGALLVGGGVPKNYVLQTMLVTPGAYDLAVQLTMDSPSTGGLSGATLDEARSWGKLGKDARNASVYGDATITLPLLIAAALEETEPS